MRNGDYKPSRFEGQQDAANLICEAKTQQNPESTLGVMAMAGKRPEIYLTQTNDIGRLLNTVGSKLPITGYIDLPRAIKIAQLSLKHRQNKNQKQRIVAFVGSPLENLEDKDVTRLGKQLRKNDVALDIINFGHPENIPLLTTLIDNCSKGGNSHLVEINYGSNICDTIITSPVVAYDMGMGDMQVDGDGEGQPGAGSGAQPGGSSGGGQFAEYGGIDPNLDPELAMAIRISLEEAKHQTNEEGNKPAEGASTAQPGQTDAPKGDVEMKDDNQAQPAEEQNMDEDDEYDEELEAAKLLSMQGGDDQDGQAANDGDGDKGDDVEGVIDEEFIGEVMNSLGVDMTEDAVKNLLNEGKKDGDKDKKDEDKKE
jgi:26S proteasome regulatory subunit N10